MDGIKPEQTLLDKAVDDREAHPWRYYRFEREELLKWLNKVADERDALRAVLAAHGIVNVFLHSLP